MYTGLQKKKNNNNTLLRVDPLLVNDLETNKETKFAPTQQILNKQVYTAVTG
jgi:hypothetical protein